MKNGQFESVFYTRSKCTMTGAVDTVELLLMGFLERVEGVTSVSKRGVSCSCIGQCPVTVVVRLTLGFV